MADWSEKWYKEKFQNMEAEPSSQSWEEISAQMDEWPSHWYKSNVDDLKLKPKADLWDRISAEIIPPSVGISFNTGFYLRSIAIVFIFLTIPLTITQWESGKTNLASQSNDQRVANNETAPNNNTEVKSNGEEKSVLPESKMKTENNNSSNQNTLADAQESFANKTKKHSNASDMNSPEFNSTKNANSTNQIKDQPLISSGDDEVNNNLKDTEPNVQQEDQERELVLINTLFRLPMNQKTIQQNYAKTIIEIPEKKFKPSNNWMIGAQLRPQISTLLNPITLSAMRGSESIQMTPGINVTYALALSRKLNNYSFIDASLEMNNRRTHKYTKSFFDTENDKSLDLNYLTLEVTHRKKSKSIFSQNPRLSFSTIKGIYGSYLMSSNEGASNNESIELKDGFRNFDLGISLGLEVSMNVQPNVEIYSGVKTQIGAIGIFKGTELVPEDFFFNSTSSTGLFIGFRKFF